MSFARIAILAKSSLPPTLDSPLFPFAHAILILIPFPTKRYHINRRINCCTSFAVLDSAALE